MKGNKGHRRTHRNTKAHRIIEAYINNPTLTLKELSRQLGEKYSYVRKVVAAYKRSVSSKKGRALDALGVGVHGFWFWDVWPEGDYGRCPVPVCGNRNGMKVYRGRRFTFEIFPPRGREGCRVIVYPFLPGWRDELKVWLSGWLGPMNYCHHVVENLMYGGSMHLAFKTPREMLPDGLRINIRGLGRIQVDKTPWGDRDYRTLEFHVAPELLKLGEDLGDLKSTTYQTLNEVRALKDELRELANVMKDLAEAIKEFKEAAKELRGAMTFEEEPGRPRPGVL